MKLELRTLSLVLLLTLNAASLAGVAGQRRSIRLEECRR